MEDVFLTRRYEDDGQTRGYIVYKGKTLAVTLELPWLNNARRISRIPAGRYKVIRHQAPNYPKTQSFWVLDVPGRSEILIHYGNYKRDTKGCILPGRKFVDINKDGFPDVTDSVATMKMLLKELPKEFVLVVENDIK